MVTTHMKQEDNEIIIELSENALDALLSPMTDTGLSASSIPQNVIMQSMTTGKNAPFPCYKRSGSNDQVVLRITTEPAK